MWGFTKILLTSIIVVWNIIDRDQCTHFILQNTQHWTQTVIQQNFNLLNQPQAAGFVEHHDGLFVTGSVQFSSVQRLQLFVTPWTTAPCPSPTPRAYSSSCPSSRWCHPTISSSVIPFSSRLQSFLASGSFQMSQFFASGGQSIEVSVSASVLPMNIQDWFPLGLTGLISLQSKSLSRVFSNITVLY